MISPIILIPLLTSKYAPSEVGKLFFYQALAVFLAMIIEYGFNLNGTKKVAQEFNEIEKCKHLTSILIAKIYLIIPSVVFLLSISLFVTEELYNSTFLTLALFSGVAQGFTPAWYYHGRNETNKALFYDGSAAILYLILTLIFVLLGFEVFSVILSQIISRVICYIFSYNKLLDSKLLRKYLRVSYSVAKKEIIEGFSFFFFRLTSSLYTKTSTFFLGMSESASVIASYSGAEKVSKGTCGLLSPISQALFPRLSYLLKHDIKQGKSLFISAGSTLIALSSITSISLFYFSETIINFLLGSGYEEAYFILKVLSLLPVVITVSNLFGVQLLLNLGLQKYFNRVIVICSLLHIVFITFSIHFYGVIGLAVQIVIIETLVAISMFLVSLFKTKFWCEQLNEK